MSKEEIKHFSEMNLGSRRDLLSEFNYQIFEQKDIIRKQNIKKREEVTRRLMPVVFPCSVQQQPTPSYETETDP
ncbi:MAG: hypothetical protein JNL60_07635 [Bacteroidia bacterium]|nr:hypothetical protein [Bacteroidia bacterium]